MKKQNPSPQKPSTKIHTNHHAHAGAQPPTQRQRIPRHAVVGFIGGYLIEQGALTLQQLDQALLKQLKLAARGEILSVGAVLIRLGYITAAELARAEQRQKADRERLGR